MNQDVAVSPRQFNRKEFDQAYQETVLDNDFFENDDYYIQQKPRYFKTLEYVCKLSMPTPMSVLEVGGGQIALLAKALFNDNCTVADVNEKYQHSILKYGISFKSFDLLHDEVDAEKTEKYDLVVMCEVIEHMPIPPHIVLEKIRGFLKPGGFLLLTTPNLYRFRNTVRLFLGLRVFDTFFIPSRGNSIGHPLEYSKQHLQWHIEQAGFESVEIQLQQLNNAGSNLWTQLGRNLASPLFLRPVWRDSLVAFARKPLPN